MSDSKEHNRKLPEFTIDTGGRNNYSAWATKSRTLLEAWDYWHNGEMVISVWSEIVFIFNSSRLNINT